MGIDIMNFSSNTSNDTNTGSFKKFVKHFITSTTEKLFSSMIGYNGWISASNSYNLWTKHITNEVKFKVLSIGLNSKAVYK